MSSTGSRLPWFRRLVAPASNTNDLSRFANSQLIDWLPLSVGLRYELTGEGLIQLHAQQVNLAGPTGDLSLMLADPGENVLPFPERRVRYDLRRAPLLSRL